LNLGALPSGHGGAHAWGRRVAVFVALFLALQAGYGVSRGGALERVVIDVATVKTATALIGWITPEARARADGPRIAAPGGGLNVLNGCEGTDVLFLFGAAMMVAPLAWRARLLGLAIGLPLVFALNQARVLALFYAFRSDRALFDTLHGAVAPLALVIAVGAFFAFWLGRHGAAAAARA
jgi:exosortase/archaeosortase family protein